MSGTESPSTVRPDRILQMLWGFAPPLVLEAALRHHVFDTLADGPQTIDELARATGTALRGLRALTGVLVGLQFLARDPDGKLRLTPESEAFLVSSKNGFLGGMFKHVSTQLLPGWMKLTEVVKSGEPALAVNQEGPGSRFFEEFVEDLFPFNYPAASALADALGIASATQPVSVLDLAAGSGVWGIVLAQKSAWVRVTAVDWPGVLPITLRVAERMGLADRVQCVASDLTTANFGTGHQIATLGHILHSEGEPRSRALLKKTFSALAPGGTIAIAEFLVNENRTAPVGGLIFAVNMLVNTDSGDTFSFEEISDWLREAGFINVRQIEAPGPSPLILADTPRL